MTKVLVPVPTRGAQLVVQERSRQIHAEGFNTEHDERHTRDELRLAALCYAAPDLLVVSHFWPWEEHWYKPAEGAGCLDFDSIDEPALEDLVKAAALLVAEIDRRLAMGGG